MRRKKITVELSEAELEQLRQYIHNRDTEDNGSAGWYYGNKEQFENRHQWIANQFSSALEAFIPNFMKSNPTGEEQA